MGSGMENGYPPMRLDPTITISPDIPDPLFCFGRTLWRRCGGVNRKSTPKMSHRLKNAHQYYEVWRDLRNFPKYRGCARRLRDRVAVCAGEAAALDGRGKEK
ncbi:hypothetical protein MASR2M74_08650 [Paracoccaceae bacterium]